MELEVALVTEVLVQISRVGVVVVVVAAEAVAVIASVTALAKADTSHTAVEGATKPRLGVQAMIWKPKKCRHWLLLKRPTSM